MAIPIIGSPVELVAWTWTIVLRCRQCEARPIVVLLGPYAGTCPGCGTQFQFSSFANGPLPIAPQQLGLSIVTVPKGKSES